MEWIKYPENKPEKGQIVLALLDPRCDDLILRLGYDGEHFVEVDHNDDMFYSWRNGYYNQVRYYIPMKELPPIPQFK